jgi:opine dehydrogenase
MKRGKIIISMTCSHVGVYTRAIDSLIHLASMMHRASYHRRGRTLERLGLENLSVSEIIRCVEESGLETGA